MFKNRRIRDFLSPSDWLNSLLLLVTLGVGIWSVQEARWINPEPSYVAILALSLLTGFILIKSRLPALFAIPLALLTGLVVIIWQGLLLFPEPDWPAKASQFITEIRLWWQAARYNAPSPVSIHIALLFGYLTWLAGYFSIWPLLKKRDAWMGVLLGGVIILVNLNFWLHDKYIYFLWYLIAALVLLAAANYTRRRSQLAGHPKYRAGWVLWTGSTICLIVVVVFSAWSSPGFKIGPIADYARSKTPFKGDIQIYWKNFFAPVPGSGIFTLVHGGQQELHFGGSLELSDQAVFIIHSNSQNYWKTQIYDIYDSTGWKTGAVADKIVDPGTSTFSNYLVPRNNSLSYVIIPQVNTSVLPTTGELISGDIPVDEKYLTRQIFEINLMNSSGDVLLPPDLAALAKTLRNSRSNSRGTSQQITSLLPSGLDLINFNRSGTSVQSISIARSQPEDNTEVALSGTQPLFRQQPANVTVETSPTVTADILAKAGAKYPATVTDRYLQLPDTAAMSRVKELAAGIIKESTTPYQKAQAIKNYLSKYPYSLTINAPPAGADGVDYFLFIQKSGYCTYFASAMTVMLRSVGIPARMVVGFLPGEYDSSTENHIIRDRDYHAWTEVYFTGSGWVNIDPTPPSASGSLPADNFSDPPDTASTSVPGIDSGTDTGQAAAASDQTNQNYWFVLTIAGAVLLAWFYLLFRRFYRAEKDFNTYSGLIFWASLAGLGPKPWQTPGELAVQISTALPQHARTVNEIIQTYGQIRYGSSLLENPDQKYRQAWPGLRWALIKYTFHFIGHFSWLDPRVHFVRRR